MSKITKINSFFTRIILAVLSFAVIVCIFIPYTRIPAVQTVQDVDVAGKYLARKIGADQTTFNISEFTHASSPVFMLYTEEAINKEMLDVTQSLDAVGLDPKKLFDEDKAVNQAAIPLPNDENVYYFVTFAYGYDVNEKNDGLKSNILRLYRMIFVKDAKNNSKVSVTIDNNLGEIKVRVPKATNFDLSRVVTTKTAWLKQDGQAGRQLPDEKIEEREIKNVTIDKGASVSYYVAIHLKSEVDPTAVLMGQPEDASKPVYLPLDVYTFNLERDASKNTLPVVGEIGGGLLSEEKNNKMNFYDDDAVMFIFMIAGALSTLFAFTIPSKFRIIELVVAIALGLALAIIPVFDMLFYLEQKFQIDPGLFVLIVLGVLIIVAAIIDFISCRSEYRAEMIHIYGEEYFDPQRKAALKAELKEKDKAFKAEKAAEKAQLKAEKAAQKASKKENK